MNRPREAPPKAWEPSQVRVSRRGRGRPDTWVKPLRPRPRRPALGLVAPPPRQNRSRCRRSGLLQVRQRWGQAGVCAAFLSSGLGSGRARVPAGPSSAAGCGPGAHRAGRGGGASRPAARLRGSNAPADSGVQDGGERGRGSARGRGARAGGGARGGGERPQLPRVDPGGSPGRSRTCGGPRPGVFPAQRGGSCGPRDEGGAETRSESHVAGAGGPGRPL